MIETLKALVASPDAIVYLFQVLAVWPFWRAYTRAGLRPYLSLVVLIPLVGMVAVLGLLALSRWPAAADRG